METTISLCMITKNEEEVLERCLSRAADHVDEIIIVDTGSTDATKEIARKYTEHVYDFEWIGDFSAARNESIKWATSQWILVLDADEYMEPEDIKGLKEFLATQTPAADKIFTMPIMNFSGKSMLTGNILEIRANRCFPNFQGISFHRPIHEQLRSESGVKLTTVFIPYRIYHTGYLLETREKKDKSKRNLQLFTKMKSEKSFEPYDFYTLGNEYMAAGDFKKAKYYYQRALNEKYAHFPWYPFCLFSLINACLHLDHLKEAWDLIESKLVKYQHFPEYSSVKGILYHELGFEHLAEQHFLEAIRISNERMETSQNGWLISPDLGYKFPHEKLANIYYKWGDIHQTIYHLTKVLMSHPMELTSLFSLIQLLGQSEEHTSIIQMLNQLYSDSNPAHLILLFQTSLKLGQRELAEYYLARCQDQQISIAPKDALRLYLLQDQRDAFDETLNQLTEEDLSLEQTKTHFMIASLVWNDEKYLQKIYGSERSVEQIHSLLKNEPVEADSLQSNINDLFSILTSVFVLQKYETYDQLMKQCQHPKIINKLANYFYSMNHTDIAIDYYTVLLEQYADELDAEGLENLAFLHFNQHFVEDGLTFLEKAIDIAPNHRKLYMYYCLRCQDPQLKEQYKQKYIVQFPQYQGLPFIKEL